MFKSISTYLNRKKLRDGRYAYLFDEDRSGEYVCFDCETTGLDPKSDDIISIGAVIIKENKILTSRKFERLIKPNTKLAEDAIKIHQIRECDLEDASELEDVIYEFLDFIGNRPLVGYYLEFDVAMVNKYIKPRLGIVLPNEMIEVSALYYDKKIERIPQGNIDLRFDSIMRDLALPIMEKHNAINDAVMTSLIFLKVSHTP